MVVREAAALALHRLLNHQGSTHDLVILGVPLQRTERVHISLVN